MIDDSVLDHPLFDTEMETEEQFHTMGKALAEAGAPFPAKVTFEEPKTVRTIRYDAEKDVFRAEGFISEWPDIADLYERIHEADEDVEFDASVLDAPGVKGVMGLDMVSTEIPDSTNRRVLISKVDNQSLEHNRYFQFLKLTKEWLVDTSNWVLAYQFIETHPAFWHRVQPERAEHLWSLEQGHKGMWVCVMTNDYGDPVVMLEHGQSVAPKHDHHYHDLRLDVWAPTFEDAYVQMARKVHKFFALDGEERPDVEYEKSATELKLGEILNEMD
jgi:hypothetical protein